MLSIFRRSPFIIAILLLSTLVFLSVRLGAVSLSSAAFWERLLSPLQFQDHWLLSLRLPRVLLSVIVGGILGLSGALVQGFFRNDLAEPGLLGITSGATLGTTLCMAIYPLHHGFDLYTWLPFAAFAGAAFTTYIVYRLAGELDSAKLLLAGVAIGAFALALSSFLVINSPNSQLRTYAFWTLGSLREASWRMCLVGLIIVSLLIAVALRLSSALDVLQLGPISAKSLGLNHTRLGAVLLLFVCLATGWTVSMTGIIAFVGLIAPHIARPLVGGLHRRLFPMSLIIGALIVCLADLFSRTLLAPEEISIGIFTTAFGAPLFLSLLKKHRRHL